MPYTVHDQSLAIKRCSKCQAIKSIGAFPPKGPSRPGQYHSWCRQCHAEVATVRRQSPEQKARIADSRKQYRKSKTAEEWRRYDTKKNLLHSFGITPADYDDIFDRQFGLCVICGSPPNGQWNRLAVDHDHSTGRIRGLLCTDCNWGIGHFLDNADLMHGAIVYLRQPVLTPEIELTIKPLMALKVPRSGQGSEHYNRNLNLRRNYGINVHFYDALHRIQHGTCAICGGTNPDSRRLFVDHNHSTGVIRGLLCIHCNTGLSFFKESERLLFEAIAYLRLHAA